MAKDDYYVIVYKILLYLYACLKRKIIFDSKTYSHAIGKDSINPDYLTDIYIMMSEEGYISGVKTTEAWGDISILLSYEKDLKITPKGIEYLQDNNRMHKIGKMLIDSVDTVASLIMEVGLDKIMP